MTCLAMRESDVEGDARAVAANLVGAAVVGLTPVAGGANNRLFAVETADGQRYALKLYGPADVRGDRLGREFDGLALLATHGVQAIPAAVTADRDRRAALYAWVDGTLATATPQDGDVDQALAFVAALLRVSAAATDWPGEAAEACLSLEVLIAQIHGRLTRLREVADEPALRTFLHDRLGPALRALEREARCHYDAAAIDPASPLPAGQRILSPSDFGFHNALRCADGRLVFVDFEYFGWDDPVKLTADFLWHPGMTLSPSDAARWQAGMADLFAGDPGYAARLAAQAPLYAIRWCLIILNEFLPERWRRRVFAGNADPAGWALAKSTQLTKAAALLDRVRPFVASPA